MGLETLNARGATTILTSWFNTIHDVLKGSLVGRGTSGAPEAGKSLGTSTFPWGVGHFNNIILGGSSIDQSLLTAPQNRIVSGKTRSTSNQPQFILPNGAAASFTLEGATINLVLDINGTAVTVSTDIIKSSLTLGPSTTPTCLVNDTDAIDQESTKTWGEYQQEKEFITVDTMGVEFQSFIGEFQIIKIAGVSTEYALAFVESATKLSRIYRGFFTDSSSAPVNRTAFANNDVITVLSTGWIFVEDDATTVDVTYVTPIHSFTAPSGPATGKYWYDMANKTWKRYDGASWQVVNRTLVGVAGIDSSNCVVARSFDFYAKCEDTNTADFEINSTSIVKLKDKNTKVSVLGTEYNFGESLQEWNITTDLAVAADMYNATEQASTVYYMYLSDEGEAVISDISPHYRSDLRGAYHPHNPWRCLCEYYNGSGSDFVEADKNYFPMSKYNKAIPYETEVSAKIANNGAATVTSECPNLINNVNRSSLGVVVTTFNPNYFSDVPPASNATPDEGSGPNLAVNNMDATGSSVTTTIFPRGSSTQDDDFTLMLSRQGYDRIKYRYWSV